MKKVVAKKNFELPMEEGNDAKFSKDRQYTCIITTDSAILMDDERRGVELSLSELQELFKEI